MLKTWVILLLCGLLPCSQGLLGTVQSVARLDKDVLENIISDTVANGNLLQSVLGGELLGGKGNDAVGSLPGSALPGQGGDLLGGVLPGQGGDLLGGVLPGQGGDLLGSVLPGQGGDLLGGVLPGQGGDLLDGVLPGQGGDLLGSVLPGQGGDLLGGVLPGQGGDLLGGLLPGQGGDLLGGLLPGKEGNLLGGLLPGQGGDVLGGLLPGQGGDLLGGLLPGQGGDLLGGLLPGQGDLLGGLLPGQGGDLLGGLLPGQGGDLLGGLLPGQGDLLGGLLPGKEGNLLGGLLSGQGGLLGGLLPGKGGGLLGSLLPGQGGLLGLKMVDIVLPKVSLKLLRGGGLDLNIYTKVELKGNSIVGKLVRFLVEVNITAQVQLKATDAGGVKLEVKECKTLLGGINVLSGFLPLKLDRLVGNLLHNVLPGVLCPVVDLVLNVLNTLLGAINSVCPLGSLGKLHYTLAGLPVFNDQHILLNLNLMLTDAKGNAIDLPPSQLPSLPAAEEHASQLFLSGDLLSSLLRLLVAKGTFNTVMVEGTLHGAVPMTTSLLQSVLPEFSQILPVSQALAVRIKINRLPDVALQIGKATVTLHASVEVLTRVTSVIKPLFVVDTAIGLSATLNITATKLGIILSLDSISVKLASSPVGSFEVDLLKNWITDIIRIGYLPVINGALEIGIPLPNLFNLNFAGATASVIDKAFMIAKVPKFL